MRTPRRPRWRTVLSVRARRDAGKHVGDPSRRVRAMRRRASIRGFGSPRRASPLCAGAPRREGGIPAAAPRVSLFLEGDPDLAALDRLGVRLRTRVGDLWTADAPLAVVAGLTRVRGLAGPRRSALRWSRMLDASVVAVNADTVRDRGRVTPGRGGPARGSWSGSWTPGSTSPTRTSSAPIGPRGFSISGIRRTTSGRPRARKSSPSVTARSGRRSRSTTRAGRCAPATRWGTGRAWREWPRATGAPPDLEERQYRYVGVAPEADLIVVGLKDYVTDTEIVDARQLRLSPRRAAGQAGGGQPLAGNPLRTARRHQLSRAGPRRPRRRGEAARGRRGERCGRQLARRAARARIRQR